MGSPLYSVFSSKLISLKLQKQQIILYITLEVLKINWMCYFNLQKFNDHILKFEWFYFQIVDWWCRAVFSSRKANAFQNGMNHFLLLLLFFEALNFPLNLYDLIRSMWKNKIWFFFFLNTYQRVHPLVSI